METWRPPIWIALLSLAILLVAPLWYGLGLLNPSEEVGHGHGGEEDHGVSKDEFLRLVDQYISNYTNEEGCALPTEDNEVYIAAFTFGYRPSKICLLQGEHYTFKIMSIDVVHGASINTGKGSLMIRLPPEELVEFSIAFEEPGEYLAYCSYFCGIGHYNMAFKIMVEPSTVGGHSGDHRGEDHG